MGNKIKSMWKSRQNIPCEPGLWIFSTELPSPHTGGAAVPDQLLTSLKVSEISICWCWLPYPRYFFLCRKRTGAVTIKYENISFSCTTTACIWRQTSGFLRTSLEYARNTYAHARQPVLHRCPSGCLWLCKLTYSHCRYQLPIYWSICARMHRHARAHGVLCMLFMCVYVCMCTSEWASVSKCVYVEACVSVGMSVQACACMCCVCAWRHT